MTKLHVAVLCGGQSAEHEVSIQSAKNIIGALDPERYQVSVVFIDRTGEWLLLPSTKLILSNPDMQPLQTIAGATPLALHIGSNHPFIFLEQPSKHLAVDVVFPILHGARGEDGTLQGLLDMINLPYVGPGTLGSAVAMDKEVTKRLLDSAGIPNAKCHIIHSGDEEEASFTTIVNQLGLPLFIKPANTGSSVGVSKVKNESEFGAAIALARQYDNKIIIEESITGREIECAVLGNAQPLASLPGEIIPRAHHAFYSYEAKYLDPEGADLKIPAALPEHLITAIQTMAKQTFKVLGCEGLARIDFFLTPEGKLYVNEANTLPGFTQISMYPKLWMVSGITYAALIDRLLTLALERFAHQRMRVNQVDVAARKGH